MINVKGYCIEAIRLEAHSKALYEAIKRQYEDGRSSIR